MKTFLLSFLMLFAAEMYAQVPAKQPVLRDYNENFTRSWVLDYGKPRFGEWVLIDTLDQEINYPWEVWDTSTTFVKKMPLREGNPHQALMFYETAYNHKTMEYYARTKVVEWKLIKVFPKSTTTHEGGIMLRKPTKE